MPSYMEKKTYTFIWEKDSMRRATIDVAITTEGSNLIECRFTGVNKIYDIDDWQFLHDLSAKIKSLCEKEGKVSKPAEQRYCACGAIPADGLSSMCEDCGLPYKKSVEKADVKKIEELNWADRIIAASSMSPHAPMCYIQELYLKLNKTIQTFNEFKVRKGE